MEYDLDGVDEAVIRRERSQARELRKTRWWQNKIAKGVCYYCGQPTPPTELTMDHVVALTRGGKSVKNNLVPACKACNTKKHLLLPGEWDEYMK